MNSKILIFGDSITWGAYDKEGGWAKRLKKYVDHKSIEIPQYESSVYILGICGDTTESLLKRIKSEIIARINPYDNLIIIIAIGINDVQFNEDEGIADISLENFKKNITKIIKTTKKFTDKILFIGLLPVDQRVNPIPWKISHSYLNDFVIKYNRKLQKVVEENNINFLNVYEQFAVNDFSHLLFDGIHPNTKGHKIIYEIIKKYLQNKKYI